MSCLSAYVTVPERDAALALAESLVRRGLAAGVNVVAGERSFYRWQGELCEAREWLLFAQVSAEAFPAFCAAVREAHSHQTPCIVAWPLTAGHAPFLRWIEENSRPPAGAAGQAVSAGALPAPDAPVRG